METSYDILGVPRNANDETIRAAFRKAAKAYHPDLNAGDPSREQQFKQVSAAYELLKNPRQRAAYDEHLSRYERYLRSVRRKRIWRFARVPVAAVVSGVTVALGVSLSSRTPTEPGPTGEEIAQRASHEMAAVHDGDDSRPAPSYTQAKASPAKEWKRVGASSDPMAVWGFALRNPRTPEAKLARSKLIKLIDTTDNAFTLHVLSVGAVDAIAKRAQQRLNKLDAPPLVEEASHIPSSSNTLEERATSFISAQISGWSSTNATQLASFANAYADQVLYYGSLKSRQAVLVDKRHLLERWPERLYEVQPDSVTAQCVADVCKVSGLIDWQTRSPRREASAKGIARFEYQIILSGDAFSILSERSSVVRPTRTGY
jgi:curved DNA-binding protein CbpA